MIFGLLFLIAAFVLLWTNEGRVNLASVARNSVQADAGVIDAGLEGELVAVTGRIATTGAINDDVYLRPGEYVQVNRWAEMYAWVEEDVSDEDETDYTYELSWTDDPKPPQDFYWPAGHENPPLPIHNQTVTAESVTIGSYVIDALQIQLPRPENLKLSYENVIEGPYQVSEDYIFEGEGRPDAPLLGDVRVSFTAVPAHITVTALGTQTGDEITPYYHQDNTKLHRVLIGDRQQAIGRLNTEYKNLLWGFRVFGAILMWVGLMLLVSPLTALLRFVPVLGNLGRRAVNGLIFLIALVLATTTILISAVAHNIWALLTILLLMGAGIYLWQRNRGD